MIQPADDLWSAGDHSDFWICKMDETKKGIAGGRI